MARVWFRCPICGVQMQGDPRFPPMCPNSANHPRMPPGHLPPQPLYVVVPRRRHRIFKFPPFTPRKQRSLMTAGMLFGGFLIFALVASVFFIILSLFLPHPPATSVAAPITDATFGGTIEAFQAQYGDPQPAGSGTARQWKITVNGIHVLLSVTPDAAESSDGQNHISAMSIGPDGGTWTQAMADQVLPTFLPGDATYQQDQNVSGVGAAHLYLSPNLGATFPASDFADSQGHLVTPGTFWAAFQKGAYVLKLGA